MKLIQQSKLYFKEGNSDKVYEIDLCQLSDNEYLVNFRYGRRGSTLKAGTKTPEAIPLEKAQTVFGSLENEKRRKGYQPEVEIQVEVELPSIEAVNPGTPQGVILQRLQDAIDGKKSFKTEWKTSRVIWKAGEMGIAEAVPYIIRLANRGSELQTYSSLWALTRMKVSSAEPLFRAYATQHKLKGYIRHMACEGLLTILEGEELAAFAQELLGKLPHNLHEDIESGNQEKLSAHLTEYVNGGNVGFLTYFYLLCKTYPQLLSYLHNVIRTCPFEPPFFKHVRAIYKLAQTRKDFPTVALLSYRFEKTGHMFNRSHPLDSRYQQYIQSLNEYVNVKTEIKSEDSRISYSQYTKEWFQRNSLEFLKKGGKSITPSEYVQLAVATLLQYSETDYKDAGERPQSEYGTYNYNKKLYYYTLINYPECFDSALLTTILFGNDPGREMQKNFKFIYGKRFVASQQYYYVADRVRPIDKQGNIIQSAGSNASSASAQSSGKSLFGAIKSIFGGNKNEPPAPPAPEPLPDDMPEIPAAGNRLELYPEYWDSMPNAYVQLLMQGRMNTIHRFAYNNLKAHPDYERICGRFDPKAILHLLNMPYIIPNQFGFELLEKRANEIKLQPGLVAQILNTNSAAARVWAQSVISGDTNFYLADLDFAFNLILNTHKENVAWIAELLQKNRFPEDRQQALLGKLVAELLQMENNDYNNNLAKMVIKRINVFAATFLSRVSWDVVEQLILSPLASNLFLASTILRHKSQKLTSVTEIPVSVVDLFMRNENPDIRQDGIKLLNMYPSNFLLDNYNFVLNQVDSAWRDVLDNILPIIRELVKGYSVGDATVRHFNYALIRKEKFEGAHEIFSAFMLNELKPYWNSGLSPKDITKLIHSQYRPGQLAGYEILKDWNRPDEFSLPQIISFGNHELLAVRHWCWTYFKEHTSRIRFKKDKALGLLDAKWDDTREFAFRFFGGEFTAEDWDTDTLIGIVDSIRPDVESFGKELITRHFRAGDAVEYLTKLSQHPSMNVQAYVTSLLNHYAAGNPEIIRSLEYYFRSVLTRVNKARVAKDRVFKFLSQEALRDAATAEIIAPVIDDMAAQSTVQDKATCIRILTEIKNAYPHLDMHLTIKS